MKSARFFFYKRTQSRFVLVVLNGGKRHTSCGPCTSKVLEAMHDARLRRALEGSQLEMRYLLGGTKESNIFLNQRSLLCPMVFLEEANR